VNTGCVGKRGLRTVGAVGVESSANAGKTTSHSTDSTKRNARRKDEMTPESAIRKMRKEADRADANTGAAVRDPGVDEWFRGWAKGVRYAADMFSESMIEPTQKEKP